MNIIFFGDSICFGQLVSPHLSWVNRISKSIYEQYDDILVINSSVNGNTTRMALERMPVDVQSYGVDIILVQFGINDCNLWETDMGISRVTKKVFEANIIEIIVRAKMFGAKKIIINTNHPTKKEIAFNEIKVEHNIANSEYNQIIREIVNCHKDVLLIDIEEKVKFYLREDGKKYDYLLSDGIHLSVKGHDLYYSIIYPIILREVKYLKGV